MSTGFQKLKGTKAYGYMMLLAMLLFFYAVFKILTPGNFGSLGNLYSYLQSSIIYSVGGMPVEDVAWGKKCYEKALKMGIGTKLNLWEKPYLF